MSQLHDAWLGLAQTHNTGTQEDQLYWSEYYAKEKSIYEAILKNKTAVLEGTVSELAEAYDNQVEWMMGFIDGISESVSEPLPELESIEADTPLKIAIDFEKLLWNMHKCEAEWLYELPEWDAIFTPEKQHEIEKNYKRSKTVVNENKVGRNDPCPCGSGKKYKKCCGR